MQSYHMVRIGQILAQSVLFSPKVFPIQKNSINFAHFRVERNKTKQKKQTNKQSWSTKLLKLCQSELSGEVTKDGKRLMTKCFPY